MSGPPTTAPVPSTATATATRPSSARSWRARSPTAPMSPIPLPSPSPRPARGLGQARVAEQVPVLAVDRDEVARAREGQHALEVLLARVAGDVDEGVVLPEDLGAEPVERVDPPADRPLVARDHARRDDHEVARRDLHVLVLARGHERERGVRLALAAGREGHLPLGRPRGG